MKKVLLAIVSAALLLAGCELLTQTGNQTGQDGIQAAPLMKKGVKNNKMKHHEKRVGHCMQECLVGNRNPERNIAVKECLAVCTDNPKWADCSLESDGCCVPGTGDPDCKGKKHRKGKDKDKKKDKNKDKDKGQCGGKDDDQGGGQDDGTTEPPVIESCDQVMGVCTYESVPPPGYINLGELDCGAEAFCFYMPTEFEMCMDGTDNDEDGLTDCADMDCAADVGCCLEYGSGFCTDRCRVEDCTMLTSEAVCNASFSLVNGVPMRCRGVNALGMYASCRNGLPAIPGEDCTVQ